MNREILTRANRGNGVPKLCFLCLLLFICSAATAPDPQAFWQLMLGINFLASLAATITALWSRAHVQRREVSFTREYVTKEELLHLVKDIQRVETTQTEMRAETKADRTLIMAAADERMEKLTSRVDRLIEGVSCLKGVMKV